MSPDQPPSLTPEERELARRLARLATPAGPPSDVDARILAAARAAVEGSVAPAPGRRRWPVVFGVAASLALAVGIAWQLRPLPDTAVEYSEAPAAAAMETTPIATDDTSVAPRAQAAEVAGTAEAARRASAQAPAGTAAGAASPEPQAFPEPSQRKTATSTAPEQTAVAAKAPVAAPAAPPPAAPAPVPATQEADGARVSDPAQRDSPTSQAVAGSRQDAGGLAPREASASAGEYGDEPLDDQPPATADAPEVRQAWLQRIRELIAAGETDAARASLEEFRRRYPDAVLPEDLRAFGK